MNAPTIAVVGASTDRSKYSNQAVRAYAAKGYTVYPVHPSADTIEGLPVFRSVRDIPGRLDRVTLYLPPRVGVAMLDELVGLDVGEVWLNPGADAPEVVEKAESLGLKVVTGCSLVAIGWRG